MFECRAKAGSIEIVISLQGEPAVMTPDYALLGYPLGNNLAHLDTNNLGTTLRSVSGYFAFISISRDRVTISTDITGGYRLYRYEEGSSIFISDDYAALVERLRDRRGVQIDESELQFWRRHRYTTGGRTFVKGIDKLEPATIYSFTSEGEQTHCWFPDVETRPNPRDHVVASRVDIEKTLDLVQSTGAPVVLLFSGGADSTALAMLMRAQGIDFTPVFFRSRPAYRTNLEDHTRAIRMAERLGMSLLTLDVDIRDELEGGAFAKPMLFDRHVAVVHFVGMRAIAERLGREAVIVCGQGADSVLSLGPSQATRGDLAARVLIFKRNGVLSRLAVAAVNVAYGPGWRRPKDDAEYLSAILNPRAYFPVVGRSDSVELANYVVEMTRGIASRFTSMASARMYLKIYGFLQGSDNQVVIQAARQAGMERVVLPYVSPRFIINTLAHQSVRREIMQPKYVVREILRTLNVPEPSAGAASQEDAVIDSDDLTTLTDRAYDREIE